MDVERVSETIVNGSPLGDAAARNSGIVYIHAPVAGFCSGSLLEQGRPWVLTAAHFSFSPCPAAIGDGFGEDRSD